MAPKRTDEEKELLEKAQKYLPGGNLGQMRFPEDLAMVIKRGKGSRVWDISGNEYIDYLLGSGPMVLGHAHPSVVNAVKEYVDRGSTYMVDNEPAILLAEELVQAVPCAEKVRFATSGTDATFQCLRLARAYKKREKILKFEGGYHGMHDYALQSLGPRAHQLKDFPNPVPDGAGIPRWAGELVLVAPFNDLETTTALIEQHHQELAAVIVEPLQRVLAPKPGFLEGLREVTARYDILLIFDEIVTGFRLAYGGAQEYYGVVPDLAAYAKIPGGGYPLSAICGREDIMRHYDQALEGTDEFIPQVGTLNANPVCATAGLATLKELKKPGTYEKLFHTGRELRQALDRILAQAEIPHQISGENPCFEVYFTQEEIVDYRSTLTGDTEMMRIWNRTLLENGILKGPSKMYSGLCHTQEDHQQTTGAFEKGVEALLKH